ncbi:MAG TPA: efflux RND transporter periplasmic adaptor subunit [Pirellulaceae bacterium]|nr:efflux RND transporter periplasmic adaptor subunit [Pirellulaceae bacterium]
MPILTARRGGAIILAIALAAGGWLLLSTGQSPAQPPKGGGKFGPPPAPKVLVTAARGDTIAEPRSFVGTVKPIRRSLVGSAVAGRVEEYLINDGDPVKAGQPIAHLRRGVIQAELNVAKGDLQVREAELGELQKSFQEEVEQAQAKLANAQATLTYRENKMQRSRALGPSVAKEIYEEDLSLYTQAASSAREAQAALRLLTHGAREMKTQQAVARVESQKAEVARLQEQFDRHTMIAPFDGWVSAEHTEVGQWVMQGDPVAEIVELNEVDIEIAVVEDFIGNLHTAVEGAVEVPALPKLHLTGRVAIINPQADARARTFPVKVRVQNQIESGQPVLKAGMFARVTLPVGKPTACVLVPKDAVVLGGPTPVVFAVATAGGKSSVRPVSVTLGPAQGTWISAIGELKEGDSVIVEGNERVRPGQEVRPEPKTVAYP